MHSSSNDKEEKNGGSRESREAQLAHLQQELPPVSPILQSATGPRTQIDSEMAEPSASSSATLDVSTTNVSLPSDTKKFLKFAGNFLLLNTF